MNVKNECDPEYPGPSKLQSAELLSIEAAINSNSLCLKNVLMLSRHFLLLLLRFVSNAYVGEHSVMNSVALPATEPSLNLSLIPSANARRAELGEIT